MYLKPNASSCSAMKSVFWQILRKRGTKSMNINSCAIKVQEGALTLNVQHLKFQVSAVAGALLNLSAHTGPSFWINRCIFNASLSSSSMKV